VIRNRPGFGIGIGVAIVIGEAVTQISTHAGWPQFDGRFRLRSRFRAGGFSAADHEDIRRSQPTGAERMVSFEAPYRERGGSPIVGAL
jgi:hypothetical protein